MKAQLNSKNLSGPSAILAVILALLALASSAQAQDRSFPEVKDDPTPGKFYQLTTDKDKAAAHAFLLATLDKSINLPDATIIYALGGGSYKPHYDSDKGAYKTWSAVVFIHDGGSQCTLGMLQTVEQEGNVAPVKIRFYGHRQATNADGYAGSYGLLAGNISDVKSGEVLVKDPFNFFKKMMDNDPRLKTCSNALAKLGNDFHVVPR